MVELTLSGATRVIAIIGDPIAQVKSPAGVTQAFQARGHDAVVVPMHVRVADFNAVVQALASVQNVDGIIATIPHKFAAFAQCATATGRSQLLGAANVLRRNPDGTWHGDMLDGMGFVGHAQASGRRIEGTRALLIGAGGAGSAIGLALLDSGVAVLAIHDADAQRQNALIARLARQHPDQVVAAPADPSGFDFIANATPMGMRPGDPLPLQVDHLQRAMHVGDVITVPEVSPLLAAARVRGCSTQTGVDMFRAVQALMVTFFLEPSQAMN